MKYAIIPKKLDKWIEKDKMQQLKRKNIRHWKINKN